MPLQNRVDPFAEIVAHPARGTLTGNRGCLHGADRKLGAARWRTKAWIICELAWRGRRRDPMPPGRWTALFFGDEAVALAAGHRPCASCRRADFEAYRRALAGELGLDRPPPAAALDARLHAERLLPGTRTQRRHRLVAEGLPTGAMVVSGAGPALVLSDALVPWTPEGYGRPRELRPGGPVEVLTPPTSLMALRGGYAPRLALPAHLVGPSSTQPRFARDA